MLTVKHISPYPDGYEVLYTANTVECFPGQIVKVFPTIGDAVNYPINHTGPDGPPQSRLFVMNEAGKTVAVYTL